jgi:hypothetical protein
MSRSQPSLTQNPATRFFEYSAKHGEVRYFDKTKGEHGENVTVAMPFRFLYLDDVYQAGGGKKVGRPPKQEFIGYFSNAVKDLKNDVLTVRNRDGIIAEGLYADVKKESGVKLIVGLYVAYHDDNKELQIGYLKLKGSSMGEWWDFCKGKNIETGVITLSRGEEMKDEDGRVYYLPAFTYGTNITDETNARAVELDVELQKYFKSYFAPREEQAFAAAANDAPTFSGEPDFGPETLNEPDDNIPF